MGTSNVDLKHRNRLPHGIGRTVYIGLRVYVRNQKPIACRGLTIRAFDFHPREVHKIIVKALRKAAERKQLIRLGKVYLNARTSDAGKPGGRGEVSQPKG